MMMSGTRAAGARKLRFGGGGGPRLASASLSSTALLMGLAVGSFAMAWTSTLAVASATPCVDSCSQCMPGSTIQRKALGTVLSRFEDGQ